MHAMFALTLPRDASPYQASRNACENTLWWEYFCDYGAHANDRVAANLRAFQDGDTSTKPNMIMYKDVPGWIESLVSCLIDYVVKIAACNLAFSGE